AGIDLRQALDLLVGGFRRDDEHRLAVAVVNRLRPVDDRDRLHAGQVHVTARPLQDVVTDHGLTAAVRGRRKPVKVAAASRCTVAELVSAPLEKPPGALFSRCHGVPFDQTRWVTKSGRTSSATPRTNSAAPVTRASCSPNGAIFSNRIR